jgi:tape measure domain-containing protein
LQEKMVGAGALRAGKAIIELTLLTGDVDKQLKKVENRLRDFGKGLRSIGSSGLKLSGAVGGMLGFTVKLAAGFEKTRAEFTAMIGSAGKASSILSQLEQFALKTPLASADLHEATRTMLSFGVAVEEVVPTLKRLGAIAGGDGERMKRLALAFGQTTAKGRLMAQEVNQMVESGFNPLQEISRTTGESMNSLMKRMEAGRISVGEVAGSFESATSRGGKFFGLLDKVAETAIGQWNNVSESLVLVARDIGDALLPMVKELLTGASKVVGVIGEWVKAHRELAVTVAKSTGALFTFSTAMWGVGAALGGVSKAIKGLLFSAVALKAAYGFLLTSPIALALLGIGAAAGAVALSFSNAADQAERFNKAVSDQDGLGGGDSVPKKPPAEPSGDLNKRIEAAKAEEALWKSRKSSGLFHAGFVDQQIADARKRLNELLAEQAAKPAGGGMSFPTGAGIAGGLMRGMQGAVDFGQAQVGKGLWALVQERMAGMKDESEAQRIAKEEAQLRLEDAIARRELAQGGILTPELKALMDRLLATQIAGIDDGKDGSGKLIGDQSTFATRFASQMFGGARREELEELRRIRRNTDPRNNDGGNGGVPFG